MSVYTDYAARLAERHAKTAPEAPVTVRCGTEHARRQLERFSDVLLGARKRVREEQINQLLQVKPEWDLLWRLPMSAPLSVQEAAARESRLLVVAPVDAGPAIQSTLAVDRPKSMRPFSSGQDESELYVTLLIDLANLQEAPLPELLASDAENKLSLSVAPSAFQNLLIRGQAVVVVGGLDELPDQVSRARAVKLVEAWMAEFPSCHYAVIVRPNAVQPTFEADTFTRCTLASGAEPVYGELQAAWAQSLAGWTPQDPESTVYAEQDRLWQHLALLLKEQGRSSIPVQEAQDALSNLVRRGRGLLSPRRRQAGEVAALLEEAPAQLAFVEVNEGQLSFTSAALVDLLAARSLAALCAERGVDAVWEQIAGRIESPAWYETIKLALRFALLESPERGAELFDRLLDASGADSWEPVLHRGLLVAAGALEGVPDGAAPVRRVVDELAAWMADGEAAGRWDAVDALLKLDGQGYATQKALDLLGDGGLNEWTRQAAAQLLGHLGSQKPGATVEALQAQAVDDEKSPRVQQAALMALGALGASGTLDGEAMDSVVTWLSERARDADLTLDLRVATVEALGTIVAQSADPSIVALLVNLSRDENEGEDRVPYSVRSTAAQGLKRLALTQESPELVEQMWEIARDAEIDDSVRTIFAEALGQLGQAEQAAKLLIELAQDTSLYPPGRRAAMEALGRVGYADPEILDVLKRIATTKDRKTKDFERLAASLAMSGVGQLELALQHLLMLIADKSIYRSTRNEALSFLGFLGSTGNEDLDGAAIAVLQIWANEENTTEDVRENAIDALCRLHAGQEEVLRDVIGIIQNRSIYPRVRRYAASQLHRLPIEDKEMVVQTISPTFYDPEEKSDLLRVPLARMLFLWSGDESALSYLRAAAEQSYMAQVRYNASMVLLEIGEVEGGYAELIKLAQNPEIADPIRRDSLRALGVWALGREDVAEAVAAVAQDATLESNVRAAAYAALGSIAAA